MPPIPTQVEGLSEIVAVSASEHLAIAVQKDGAGFVWRPASSDQSLAGVGSAPMRLPRAVETTVDIVAIAAGSRFAAVLLGDGAVWVWSKPVAQPSGETGAAGRWSWTQLVPLPAIARIAAGGNRLVGVDRDGNAWTWQVHAPAPPVRFAQVDQGVEAAIRNDHGYVVKPDGAVFGWSEREPWLMGDGSRIPLPPGRHSMMPLRLKVSSGDTNANGVPDEWEIAQIGDLLHPVSDDLDGDGLSAVREFSQASNPMVADTDGDGSSDAVDPFPDDSFNGRKPVLTVHVPPGGFLESRSVVEVSVADEEGEPLVGAGLDFRIGGEIATIGPRLVDAADVGYTAHTDQQGVARVYVKFLSNKPDLLTLSYGFEGKLHNLVVEVKPPRLVLTAPKFKSIFQTSDAIRIDAMLTDGSNLRVVEFYADTQKIGEVLTPPYRFVWTGATPGNYDLSAVGRPLEGESFSTGTVWIEVVPTVNLPPYVRLLTPSNATGVPTFRVGDGIVLRATASDPDGTVTKVEFFAGAQKLGECLQEPYEIAVKDIPVGKHKLTAKAHDDARGVRASDYQEMEIAPVAPDLIRVSFEAEEGFVEGAVKGQKEWSNSSAEVVRREGGDAGRWLRIPGGNPVSAVGRTLPSFPVNQGVCFYEFLWKPVAGGSFADAPRVRMNGAELAVVQEHGAPVLVVGKAREGRRLDLSSRVKEKGIDLLRVVIRENRSAHNWDCFIDGKLVAFDVPSWMRRPGEMEISGHRSEVVYFDDLRMTLVNPLFVDVDRDGLPDAWEMEHRLDPTADDRASDFDGDGFSNLEEFWGNTSPSDEDTDHDGLRDGWEKTHGFSPLIPAEAAGLALDEDQDGLNLLQESAAGTDPKQPDTDGDGLSDGVEVSHRLDPLTVDASVDSDGDGVSNADEIAAHTDPADYYNGTQPIVTPLGSPDEPLIEDRYLAFLVTNAAKQPLPNAPLKMKADGKTYGFAPSWENRWSKARRELEVRTDQAGIAKFYVVRVDELTEPLR